MTLNEPVLQKVAEWRPAEKGRHILSIPDENSGWTVNLTADRNDELGCLVWEMGVHRSAAPTDARTLQSWADRIAGRVTGLLEPLKVLEVDAPRNEALLRSEKPTRRGDALYYFEVHLKGMVEATLRRYQAVPDGGKPRAQVAYPLTHEALAKVAADLTAD